MQYNHHIIYFLSYSVGKPIPNLMNNIMNYQTHSSKITDIELCFSPNS